APLFLDVALPPDGFFETELPSDHTAFVYVHEGTASFGPQAATTTLAPEKIGVLGPGERVAALGGSAPTRFLLLAGRPLKEPAANYAPFVITPRAELSQPFAD